MVLGQGSLFGSSPATLTPPLYPPSPSIYLVPTILGSCHLIQLITDWDGLWETRLGSSQHQRALAQGAIHPSIDTL